MAEETNQAVGATAPERIWVQKDFSFFHTMGNGTYYRNPDSNSVEYVCADLYDQLRAEVETLETWKEKTLRRCEEADNALDVSAAEHTRLTAELDALREENETLKAELMDALLNIRGYAEDVSKARLVAAHVEEAGEVCVSDCIACNDPIKALIVDLKETRRFLTFERMASKGAVEYSVEVEAARDALLAEVTRLEGELKEVWEKAADAIRKVYADEGMTEVFLEALDAAQKKNQDL